MCIRDRIDAGLFLWEDFFVGGVCLVGCEEGFLEVGGFFFFRFYQLPTQTPPTPLSPPKRGFRLFSFFIEGSAFRKQPWRQKVYEKEHKGKLISPCGEARQSLAFP